MRTLMILAGCGLALAGCGGKTASPISQAPAIVEGACTGQRVNDAIEAALTKAVNIQARTAAGLMKASDSASPRRYFIEKLIRARVTSLAVTGASPDQQVAVDEPLACKGSADIDVEYLPKRTAIGISDHQQHAERAADLIARYPAIMADPSVAEKLHNCMATDAAAGAQCQVVVETWNVVKLRPATTSLHLTGIAYTVGSDATGKVVEVADGSLDLDVDETAAKLTGDIVATKSNCTYQIPRGRAVQANCPAEILAGKKS